MEPIQYGSTGFHVVNDIARHFSESNPVPHQVSGAMPAPPKRARFFQPTDWLSFGLTSTLALAGYWLTLAPDVTLGSSGIFSVGAMYAGVPLPPGYPLWTIYARLFIWLLPFSNIAWRVAVSSAVAGALACGMIALMVARGGAMIVEGIPEFNRTKPGEVRALRVVSGCVAGMALGFGSSRRPDDRRYGRCRPAVAGVFSQVLTSLINFSSRRPYSTKFLRVSASDPFELASWKTTTMCGSMEMPPS